MLLFKRPPKPQGFDEEMEPYRSAVADLVAAGGDPSFDESAWRRYKRHFSDVQHGKCGFCESYVYAADHGAVEHYRPKGAVSTLVAAGVEIEGTPNVRGRRVEPVTKGPLANGYWWLHMNGRTGSSPARSATAPGRRTSFRWRAL